MTDKRIKNLIVVLLLFSLLISASACSPKKLPVPDDEHKTVEDILSEKDPNTNKDPGQTTETPTDTEPNDEHKTVEEIIEENHKIEASLEYNGKKYGLNPNVKSYLILGIDEDNESGESQSIVAGGQSDLMMLCFVNDKTQSFSVLQLNRDTMTTVYSLDPWGKPVFENTMQICLAHAYGNGLDQSCENSIRSVKALLGDINIDGYISLNMGCIGLVNDAIGGVNVTIRDDFSEADPSLKMGETIRLNGQQAYNFLRFRKNVGDGSNEARMNRHRVYLTEFQSQLKSAVKNNASTVNTVLNTVNPYMYTNMSTNDLSKLANSSVSYKNNGIITLKGQTVYRDTYGNGTIFAEFHPDKDATIHTILNLSYVEVK